MWQRKHEFCFFGSQFMSHLTRSMMYREVNVDEWLMDIIPQFLLIGNTPNHPPSLPLYLLCKTFVLWKNFTLPGVENWCMLLYFRQLLNAYISNLSQQDWCIHFNFRGSFLLFCVFDKWSGFLVGCSYVCYTWPVWWHIMIFFKT